MKQYLGLAMVFALVVSVGPALAGESFHALSPLPEAQLAALSPLDDAQLATIEGTDKYGHKDRKKDFDKKDFDKKDFDKKDFGKKDRKKGDDIEVCIACFNIATVTQVNVAVDDYLNQLNAAAVSQQIN